MATCEKEKIAGNPEVSTRNILSRNNMYEKNPDQE
jgi:hypothetical protein